MSIKLLPCPFCGGNPIAGWDTHIRADGSDAPYAYVTCCASVEVLYTEPLSRKTFDEIMKMSLAEIESDDKKQNLSLTKVKRLAHKSAAKLWNTRTPTTTGEPK